MPDNYNLDGPDYRNVPESRQPLEPLSIGRFPRQLGAVLVFKPGTTRLEAEAAVVSLRDVLDDQYWLQPQPIVHEFNPEHGGPVWYIP